MLPGVCPPKGVADSQMAFTTTVKVAAAPVANTDRLCATGGPVSGRYEKLRFVGATVSVGEPACATEPLRTCEAESGAGLVLSETASAQLYGPAAVGVPPIVAVPDAEPFSVSPAGRAPALIDQVNGPIPLEAMHVSA